MKCKKLKQIVQSKCHSNEWWEMKFIDLLYSMQTETTVPTEPTVPFSAGSPLPLLAGVLPMILIWTESDRSLIMFVFCLFLIVDERKRKRERKRKED